MVGVEARLRGAVSGGGMLALHLDRFLDALGLPILVGYGLTETSPVVALRRFEDNVLGTIGRALQETECRVVDPSGRLAGRLALVGAACLLPVSVVPSMLSPAGWAFGITATLSGLAHLAFAARFAWRPDDARARALWRVSLVHLPLLLVALVLAVRW